MPQLTHVFTERAILPNTTGAYILRVSIDGSVEALSIVAWRIEWTKDRRENGSESESSAPWPITIEDDYDEVGNVVDFIADRGVFVAAFTASFTTMHEAIAYAQEELAAKSGPVAS